MDFTRGNYRGLEVEWFAVDRRGSISILSTGYGDIPKIVFESEARYDQLRGFFEARPETAEARLVDALAGQSEGYPGYALFLQEARRGLYSYWQSSYSTLDPYELIAYPVRPASVDMLPSEIQVLLEPFQFTRLEFAAAQRIVVQDHFECD